MKLIVGLGNPGTKYERTRHNLGFMALDTLLEKFEPLKKTFWEPAGFTRRGLAGTGSSLAVIKQIRFGDSTLLLAKPTTFMNNSGFAVSRIISYYKINPQDMTVVHDDLDLPFGKIRVRFGGSAGGHRGVESIIEQLKTDRFLRIRLGVGNPRRIEGKEIKSRNYENVDQYVLSDIASSERGKLKTMLKDAVSNVDLILEHGIDRYMSKYNK